MRTRAQLSTTLLLFAALPAGVRAAESVAAELDRAFHDTVRPFVEGYCIKCHSGEKPKGHFDLEPYATMAAAMRDHESWALVLDKLAAVEMPPEEAEKQPGDAERQRIIAWIEAAREHEANRQAGDPGIVLARRLSNAEYNYTIRDLTGVDIQPAREFPVDPANPAGFDNSGESLAMSPALLTKYLQAARTVASHLVLKPDGLAFAPHPMLVETDRDKYCVSQIMEFYQRQATDYADYFEAAWRYQHRAALGSRNTSLDEVATAAGVSPKYLATVWHLLEETVEDVGPTAKLQRLWRELPAPKEDQPRIARPGCEQMRDFVVTLRKKIEPRFPALSVRGISGTAQPFRMWVNRLYATHRRSFDRAALQIEGEASPAPSASEGTVAGGAAAEEDGPEDAAARSSAPDPDLFVPAGQRARYEAAFARFCAVFPDAFYVSERGRNYLDTTKDRGRFLSAGFHNLMGYFRDDQPLCELILDDAGRAELDKLWRELDFVAAAAHRTFVQFYFNESGEARGTGRESEGPRPADTDVTTEAMIRQVAETYLKRAEPSANATASQAITEHFDFVNASIRWVEQARIDSEPRHLDALLQLAAQAYRRPLTREERDDLLAFYRTLRSEAGLVHEEAMRDLVVAVLVSPDFCYRIDLVDPGEGIRPLSDFALASRLSYFLWSSMPDDALLARAAAGELHRPEVLAAEARRMLQDERARALALEFGGHWLDFRRFEELNTVDRERFTTFTNELRQAMFEEPVRFMLDVFQRDRAVLDLLFADDTFVNPELARHYGMPEIAGSADTWVRVEHAGEFGRGGILPMAAFLTMNAPGLRTSPVKRGYWVVKRVLGEHIPPPPAAVPELPRDEAKMDLPLRETLARHREDKSCASCHARFDSLGLVFEGYGPVGEHRAVDLAGRAVDAQATFPGGSEGTGFAGLRDYVRAHRQDDFIDNLCRKLLAYALGRSLILSDEATIREMRARLAADDHRFSSLVTSIVTSPQFLTKRGPDLLTMKGD